MNIIPRHFLSFKTDRFERNVHISIASNKKYTQVSIEGNFNGNEPSSRISRGQTSVGRWPCCVTVVSLLCHPSVTVASLMRHPSVTVVSPQRHSCVTHASPLCHSCVIVQRHSCVAVVSLLCHSSVILASFSRHRAIIACVIVRISCCGAFLDRFDDILRR